MSAFGRRGSGDGASVGALAALRADGASRLCIVRVNGSMIVTSLLVGSPRQTDFDVPVKMLFVYLCCLRFRVSGVGYVHLVELLTQGTKPRFVNANVQPIRNIGSSTFIYWNHAPHVFCMLN